VVARQDLHMEGYGHLSIIETNQIFGNDWILKTSLDIVLLPGKMN
jgi:hypothetical protein